MEEEKKKSQQKSISAALLGHRGKQNQLPTALALLGVCSGTRDGFFCLLKLRRGVRAEINRTRTASLGEKQGIQSALESWQEEPEVDE